jgi:hypothetical protein
MSAMSLCVAQEQFTAALPAITGAARYAFRRRRPQDRDEAIAEAQACAWKAWRGLVERGKDPVAVGVSGIAGYAVRHVKNGRRIGNRCGGRGSMDVFHFKAQAACGFKVVGLDRDADREPGRDCDAWREWLACDNRVGPADEAAFRVDFEGWLAGLPERKRRVAELLAEGHDGVVVARTVGIAPSRVTQLRSELAAHWRAFQGQAEGGPRRAAVATA